MASMPVATTFAGVSKSGSPISRWTTSLPCASKARARASTSKAVSVPRPAIRLASLSSACAVSPWLIFLCLFSVNLFVDRLLLALRTQHVRDGVGYAAGGLLEISDLEVAQKTQGQHLPAKHDQDCGKYQKWAVFSHHRLVMEQLREHQPECGPQSTQQGKDADAAKQVQRAKHVLEQKADSDQIKKHSEGSRDSVVRGALGPHDVVAGDLANGSHIPRG